LILLAGVTIISPARASCSVRTFSLFATAVQKSCHSFCFPMCLQADSSLSVGLNQCFPRTSWPKNSPCELTLKTNWQPQAALRWWAWRSSESGRFVPRQTAMKSVWPPWRCRSTSRYHGYLTSAFAARCSWCWAHRSQRRRRLFPSLYPTLACTQTVSPATAKQLMWATTRRGKSRLRVSISLFSPTKSCFVAHCSKTTSHRAVELQEYADSVQAIAQRPLISS